MVGEKLFLYSWVAIQLLVVGFKIDLLIKNKCMLEYDLVAVHLHGMWEALGSSLGTIIE